MDPHVEELKAITRRYFFQRSGAGIGTLALAALANERLFADSPPAAAAHLPTARANPLAPKPPHFPARAKHVIYLHMAGAPPQLELFDYKPKLVELNGQPCPESLYKKAAVRVHQGHPKLLGTPYKFTQHGKRRRRAVRAAAAPGEGRRRHRDRPLDAHRPVQPRPGAALLQHRLADIGRPSMGSWITYGLGTREPGPARLRRADLRRNGPDGGTSLWGSGFLPSVYQGVQFRSQGDPVLYVSESAGHGCRAPPPLARRAQAI